MINICKEYKGLRVSLEENFNIVSVFLYRDEKFLTSVDIVPTDTKRVLQAMLEPLVEEERYEESIVIRDLIKELPC